MVDKRKSRMARLEQAFNPPKQRRWLQTFSNQNGRDGEAIREETDEEVIARHLAEHPEDAGLEFDIMNIVWVSPKNTDIGANHDTQS